MVDRDGKRTHFKDETDLTLTDIKTGKAASVASICQSFWREHSPKNEGDVTWECSCGETADSPKIRKLGVGIRAAFSRTLHQGRLHFQGLVNGRTGKAHAPGFRIEVDKSKPPLATGDAALQGWSSWAMMMRTTVVETTHPLDRAQRAAIFHGHLTFSFAGDGAMCIPVSGDD